MPVRLRGVLRCADPAEAQTVALHLPQHLAATRAEAGCTRFEVESTADPLTWRVEECFVSAEAFLAHQARAAASAWGAATAGIERRYRITGLDAGEG